MITDSDYENNLPHTAFLIVAIAGYINNRTNF